VLKRHDDGDIEDLSAASAAGNDEYARLSRYLSQLFLPRSADMYPLASDGVEGDKEMSIVINNKLCVSEDQHLWNVSLRAIEGSGLKPSARIVKQAEVAEGGDIHVVLRHTWQEKTQPRRMRIHKHLRSGILLGVRERLYTTQPNDVIDIQPLITVLLARSNDHKANASAMHKARTRCAATIHDAFKRSTRFST
jgi:hypothetical protein